VRSSGHRFTATEVPVPDCNTAATLGQKMIIGGTAQTNTTVQNLLQQPKRLCITNQFENLIRPAEITETIISEFAQICKY
jgi:hypothetical protein